MAYQSEIELRVKVIDSELKELERRIERVQNPFSASGGRKGPSKAADRQARENLRIEKERLDFVKRAVEDEERLRIAKARNTQRIKQRLLQIERSNRIKAAQDVARAEQALARENARRREDLALGVGFPLLFGGGAGAVAGGALGAVAGGGKGGFGLQILFSALGQQIDNFFAGVQESALTVATALDGTSASLEAVREAGIVVKDSTIEYVQQLEDSGRSLDAYNAVQRELNNIYGTEGVTVLQELKAANEFANTEAGKLGAVLQTELAPAFILLAQLGGGAARALREVVPAIADAIGEFTLGIPGATTTAQLSKRPPGTDPARVAAGARQREAELRTDAEIRGITAGTEALRRQTEIAQRNNDLTDERVVALRRAQITIEAQNEVNALNAEITKDIFNADLRRLNIAKIQKVRQQETLDLAKLEVNAQNAVTSAAEKATREKERQERIANRLAARVQGQNAAAASRLAVSRAELRVAKETSELSKIDLEFDLESTKVKGRYAKLISKALSDQEKETLEKAQKLDLELLSVERNEKISNHMRDQFQSAMQLNDELLQTIPQTAQLSDEFKTLANTINNEIINGIEGMIAGTKTLGQVASSMLKQIASQMLQTAIMGPQGSGGIGGMLLSGIGSIFGGGSTAGPGGYEIPKAAIPKFANGGRPPVGRASLVGERGPELFVPRSSGTIVPNNAIGGTTNVVVNVDAKGTAAQGDDAQAGQLGRLIGAAVQAELIKQKRPGGLLTR